MRAAFLQQSPPCLYVWCLWEAEKVHEVLSHMEEDVYLSINIFGQPPQKHYKFLYLDGPDDAWAGDAFGVDLVT